MLYEQLKKALQSDISDLTRKNLNLTTGKRINKPSDDPAGTIRVLDYKVSISLNDQYKRNIQQAGIFLGVADKALGSSQDSLAELSKILSYGDHGTSTKDSNFYSSQAALYRDSLLDTANSKLGERYLFSGYQTDTQAFTFDSTTNHYVYNGDLGAMSVSVDRSGVAQVNIQGSKAFSVTMPGPTPTSLSDGTPVSYSQVTDPNTGVNTITVEIGNAGDLDHDTFTVSNVMDVANYMSFAWKGQDVDGTALDASAVVAEQKSQHRLQALYPVVKDASTQLLQNQTEIGTREAFLKDRSTRLDNENLTLESARSTAEDADMNATLVDIKMAEVALEALRSSSAQIISQSLFNFLQ